jgi:T-complex protein 1 subunit gamma
LAENCGADVVRVLTQLRAKHTEKDSIFLIKFHLNLKGECFGIDGNKGVIADMKELDVWDPLAVKVQTIKTAIEVSCMLLRIDDIVSGIKKSKKEKPKSGMAPQEEANETFGDARDG